MGDAFKIDKKSVEVFSESFVRAHIIFQLSKLADGILGYCRRELKLPPYIIISQGKKPEATGALKYVAHLSDLLHVESLLQG